MHEVRGSASGAPSPWAQGHSGDSPLGPTSPFQGSYCTTCRSRLGESSSLPQAPHPTSPPSPPPIVHLSVSLQSYLSLAFPTPSLFLSSCSCPLFPLFVSLPVSSQPPVSTLSLRESS